MKVRATDIRALELRSQPSTAGKVSGDAAKVAKRADQVRLSEIAQLTQVAQGESGAESVASPERLAKLRALIETESYSVEPEALAAAILQEEWPE